MKNQLISGLALKCIGFCFLIFLLTSPVQAQQSFKIVQSLSKIDVKGTSNLHEWESYVTSITGELNAISDGTSLKQVNNVSINIPVSSIKSGKSIMDSKTWDALKSKQFPMITYQSTINNIPRENVITSIGQLTIAGVTKSRTISATSEVLKDGSIHIKGNIKVKMSEFGMAQVTAIMGTLKTGDETEIDFDVIFKP